MKYLLFAFTCLLMTACQNNTPVANPEKNAAVKDSVPAQQDFFPVPDYIGGQLKIIDSLQLPISLAVTINNKTRLTTATDKQLRAFADEFRRPDISDPAVKKLYTQTSIADQSDPSVTLIYTTTDTSLPIQKINVYVKPDPVANDKVSGIYIEKMFTRNDTVFNKKLYWKTGRNMQVTTEMKVGGKQLPVEQVKITWDYSN
ncbi:MAG: hypothetical protein ABIU63_06705 [Chitinophagaceae bacterium]